MTPVPSRETIDAVPTYLSGGDPAGRFTDYYPTWLDNLADDATLEGSLLDGAVRGAEAVRTLPKAVRGLYDNRTFTFAGPWGDNGFIEDYTAQVGGEPIGSLVLITRRVRCEHAARSMNHYLGEPLNPPNWRLLGVSTATFQVRADEGPLSHWRIRATHDQRQRVATGGSRPWAVLGSNQRLPACEAGPSGR